VEAREDADRLRVRLAESEARAAAAEQRLEEVATRARDRQTALEDALERQRLAESDLNRARREIARLEGETRSGLAQSKALEEKARAVVDRDERILRLEGDKQDLLWRLAELEDKLRQAISRAVHAGAGRGEARAPVEPAAPAPSPDLNAAREAQGRAIEEFHRAAAAHVLELTELKASLAEQTALVAELEDALAVAEARAASAGGETANLRQTAKTLEESDRSRRARLAELEGKLLRLEHERKAAQQASSQAVSNDEQLLRLQSLEQERDRLRARVGELEAAQARAARPNGHPPAGAAIARELESIESDLRHEVQRLEALDRDVRTGDHTTGVSDPARLENTLENYRSRASRLRDDLEGIRRRVDSLSPSEISGFLEELREDLAELGG
jgi:DNA repair exonuclease SbcCD ATPase subunit